MKNDFTKYINLLNIDNEREKLATILNIHKKDIDFSSNFITLKDFKNNTTYKSFLTDELKNLLEVKTKNLSMNDKIFITNPEKRLRAILDNLFNKVINNDMKMTLRYAKLSPDSGRKSIDELHNDLGF